MEIIYVSNPLVSKLFLFLIVSIQLLFIVIHGTKS